MAASQSPSGSKRPDERLKDCTPGMLPDTGEEEHGMVIKAGYRQIQSWS